MPSRNPLQKVSMDLLQELTDLKAKAKKSKAVPFGMERVTKSEAQARLSTLTRADLEAMSLTDYQQLVKSVGADAIMEVLSRGQQQGGQQQGGQQQPTQQGQPPQGPQGMPTQGQPVQQPPSFTDTLR